MTEDAADMQAAQVPSPCRSLCNLNHDAICSGCYRKSSEISFWVSMTNEEKLEVIERARQREKEALGKEGA